MIGMIRSSITPAYVEPQADAERASQEREASNEAYQRLVGHTPIEEQINPAREQQQSQRLRLFAAHLIQQRQYLDARAAGEGDWRDVAYDSEEVRSYCRLASMALSPVIESVLRASVKHEQTANSGETK